MAKINLTESEKNRIRGLHKSHVNQHGTIIKEGPTGARYGHGFKDEMGEMDREMTETAATAPGDWKSFWDGIGDYQKDIAEKLAGCDDESLKSWMAQNKECTMANVMQNPNCKMSFEKAVNLAGVLACLGVKSLGDLGGTLEKMAKGLGFGE